MLIDEVPLEQVHSGQSSPHCSTFRWLARSNTRTNCIHSRFDLAEMEVATVNDFGFEYQTATLNGVKYNYILAEPASGKVVGTIFLIHGWPDLSLGWRNQIPFLLSKGLRVVAPDMMGYGETDAPEDVSF